MNNLFKNLAIWLIIGLVLMTVFNQFNSRQAAQSPMEYSQFIEEVKSGRIAKVLIEGRVLKATTNEGMDSIGQGKALAVQAICLISKGF